MKKTTMLAVAACAAIQVCAAAPRGRAAAAAPAPVEEGEQGGRVTIEVPPKLGRNTMFAAPSVNGQSAIGRCYTKPRYWIVLETKYQTYAKCQERLTFTWHVLLDSKTATENKANRDKLAPYSYLTATTTYVNIPKGRHAACVCLHPSYAERYGEPRAVGLVVTDARGEVVTEDCDSQVQGIKPHEKFWENREIMDAKVKGTDDPMIERREGLQDRSKTIWAMVNPDDYELVAQ